MIMHLLPPLVRNIAPTTQEIADKSTPADYNHDHLENFTSHHSNTAAQQVVDKVQRRIRSEIAGKLGLTEAQRIANSVTDDLREALDDLLQNFVMAHGSPQDFLRGQHGNINPPSESSRSQTGESDHTDITSLPLFDEDSLYWAPFFPERPNSTRDSTETIHPMLGLPENDMDLPAIMTQSSRCDGGHYLRDLQSIDRGTILNVAISTGRDPAPVMEGARPIATFIRDLTSLDTLDFENTVHNGGFGTPEGLPDRP